MTAKCKASSKEKTYSMGRLLFLIFAFFIVAIVFVAGNSFLQAKGNVNQEIKEDIASLKGEKASLEKDIAALSSPQHVEEVATSTLGMVKANEENVIFYLPSQKEKKEEKRSLSEKMTDVLASH